MEHLIGFRQLLFVDIDVVTPSVEPIFIRKYIHVSKSFRNKLFQSVTESILGTDFIDIGNIDEIWESTDCFLRFNSNSVRGGGCVGSK